MKKCERCGEELMFEIFQQWGGGGDKFEGYHREYWCKNCGRQHEGRAGILDILFWHLRYRLYTQGMMTPTDVADKRGWIKETQSRWDSIDNSNYKL